MRAASEALIAHLSAVSSFKIAHLYTLTLPTGTIIYFTDWERDVYGGQQPFLAQATVINLLTNGGALSQWLAARTLTLPCTFAFDVFCGGAGLVDLMLFASTGPNGYIFRFDARSGFGAGQILKLTAGTWTNIGTQVPANNAAALTGWHHVVCQYDSSGSMKIYVDGVLWTSASDTTYAPTGATYYGYEVASGMQVRPSPLFSSTGFQIKRPAIKTAIGGEVAETMIELSGASAFTVDGVPFLAAIQQGLFEFATLRIERMFMPTPLDASLGTILIFLGQIGTTETTRLSTKLTVRSFTYRFDQPIPRNVFQPSCRWTLFGPGCGLNKASFATTITITGGGALILLASGASQATGYFDQGYIVGVTGANAGRKAAIQTHTNPNSFRLRRPLPFTPANGDTFTAYPGCDKTQTTCDVKFGNLINLGAEPYTPAPETAI